MSSIRQIIQIARSVPVGIQSPDPRVSSPVVRPGRGGPAPGRRVPRFDQIFVSALTGQTDRIEEAQRAAQRFYRPETQLYAPVQLNNLYGTVPYARTDPNGAGKQALRILAEIPPDRHIKRVTLAHDLQRGLKNQPRTVPSSRVLVACTTSGTSSPTVHHAGLQGASHRSAGRSGLVVSVEPSGQPSPGGSKISMRMVAV